MAKRARTKTYLLFGLGFILLAALVGFNLWAKQPVSTTPASSSVEGISSEKSFTPLSTNLFTAQIPSTLTLKSREQNDFGVALNQLFLTSNQGTPSNPITDQLAITVGQLPGEGLTGLSNVQFRFSRPEQYREQEASGYGQDSLVFIKRDDGYEKSVFWVEGAYYAAIVVSGTVDRADSLDEDLNTVIKSWDWLVQ